MIAYCSENNTRYTFSYNKNSKGGSNLDLINSKKKTTHLLETPEANFCFLFFGCQSPNEKYVWFNTDNRKQADITL